MQNARVARLRLAPPACSVLLTLKREAFSFSSVVKQVDLIRREGQEVKEWEDICLMGILGAWGQCGPVSEAVAWSSAALCPILHSVEKSCPCLQALASQCHQRDSTKYKLSRAAVGPTAASARMLVASMCKCRQHLNQ